MNWLRHYSRFHGCQLIFLLSIPTKQQVLFNRYISGPLIRMLVTLVTIPANICIVCEFPSLMSFFNNIKSIRLIFPLKRLFVHRIPFEKCQYILATEWSLGIHIVNLFLAHPFKRIWHGSDGITKVWCWGCQFSPDWNSNKFYLCHQIV